MSNNSASPADKATPPAPSPIVPGQRPAATTGVVILLVDDDAAVRATVLMQLERLGYTVREADGAQAALQIINSTGKIDLLFTDIVMAGGMNGKQLAIEARWQRPDLPILFASGFPGTAQHDGVAFDEHDVLLRKPFRKQELACAVREMLATRR